MNGWLLWAQQFQTAIVGVIGFVGVIITLGVNARMARQARTETLTHQRNTLRTGLCEELRVLRNMYDGNANSCAEFLRNHPNPRPTQGIEVPVFTVTDFYDASIANLGTLTEAEVAKVLHAYLLHRQMRHRVITHLGKLTEAGTGVRVPGENAALLKGVCEAAVPIMDEAINVLGAAREP